MKTLWLLVACTSCFAAAEPAIADQEVSNHAHVTSGTFGKCYARSIPSHTFDPSDAQRQQGKTHLYQVTDADDVLTQTYDWFSQKLFVRCGQSNDTVVVRLGPWQRGHDPKDEHLAIAFYKNGQLIRRYSALEIAGDEKAEDGGISIYRNASASVSHYTVFSEAPQTSREVHIDGAVFAEKWVVLAKTIDGRALRFDLDTGEIF